MGLRKGNEMTRVEELLALAEEAREVASGGVEKPWQVREVKLAKACEQLIELVRLQNEALEMYVERGYCDPFPSIAAFERFKQGVRNDKLQSITFER